MFLIFEHNTKYDYDREYQEPKIVGKTLNLLNFYIINRYV